MRNVEKEARRERITALIRAGYTNAEIVGRGFAHSTVRDVRRSLKVEEPGDGRVTSKDAKRAIAPLCEKFVYGRGNARRL